jgi:RNase P/RNase MRP subunit POP5
LTVRDKVGRTRYIGFQLESTRRLSRDELTRALAEQAHRDGKGLSFQLTVFEGGLGILKVPHRSKEDSIRLLSSLRAAGADRTPVRIRTIITSGTICNVKEGMGIPSRSPSHRHGAWQRGSRPGKPKKGAAQTKKSLWVQ